MNVGLVSLGEAGNYGDDLILLAVLNAIESSGENHIASFTSFGRHLPLDRIRERFPFSNDVSRVSMRKDLPGSTHLARNFEDADVMFVGGGGLFQTSHHQLRPYHWLRHLPATGAPVIGVGLGLGPLSSRWRRYFSAHPSPFDRLAVRDDHSASLAGEFGWPVERCEDFIDREFLDQLTATYDSRSEDSVLGVALRAWPGLSVEETAQHILSVAHAHPAESVEFFVLESIQGTGPDVDFTRAVMSTASDLKNSAIHVYSSDNFIEFTEALTRPTVAISMKLHSSAFWAQRGVSLYPIVYAPKMASFFNRPYRGLEIVPEPIQIRAIEQEAPRAQAIIRETLSGKLTDNKNDTRHTFRRSERVMFQAESLVIDAYAKLRSL